MCFAQVAFHIQPYKGRTDQSMHDNIKYIIDKYVVLSLLPLSSALDLFPFIDHRVELCSPYQWLLTLEVWRSGET